MLTLYTIIVLAGRYGEAICVANDLEQGVFAAIRRMVELMPWLRTAANVTERKIRTLP
jgi:hypothetical protein